MKGFEPLNFSHQKWMPYQFGHISYVRRCPKVDLNHWHKDFQSFALPLSYSSNLSYTKTHTAISWDKINKGLGKINNKTRKNNEAPINIDLSLSILSTKVQDLEVSKYMILIKRK